MPARKTRATPEHRFYYIYVMRYADEAVKARIQAGAHAEMGDYVAQAQLATTDYQAAQALYRALKTAQRDPLAFEALVEVGNEKIIDVTIKH